MTARSEQQQDDVYDAMIDSYDAPVLGGEYTIGATMIATRFGLANKDVETPLVSSTTVRTVSPDKNNMVGSSATHTMKKRQAEEDEPPAHYSPSLYLDGDLFAKFNKKHCPILHLGGPSLGEHIAAKKTKMKTVGTSSLSSALDTETLRCDVPTSSPFKNDPVDESFVLKTLHDPALGDGWINPVHMLVREQSLTYVGPCQVGSSSSVGIVPTSQYTNMHIRAPCHPRASTSFIVPTYAFSCLMSATVTTYIPEWIKRCIPRSQGLVTPVG
jgi:hypothetical protein